MDSNNNIKIAIIGGGPSGIMAAYSASLNTNASVDLYERNEKLGKKLYITGKGRCNVTNSGSPEDFFNSISRNSKFFYSAFYTFDNNALIALFEENGAHLKTERGNRVFPVSDKSSDILRALNNIIDKKNINIFLNSKINNIKNENGKFILNHNGVVYDKCIIAGGGKSYPVTGSDGSLYHLAEKLGHRVTPLSSGLCGMNTTDTDTYDLSGLSLKNVVFTIQKKGKNIYSQLGEMEFTHYGISGPIVLSASSAIDERSIKEYEFTIDLKPGLDETKLDARIMRDIADEPNKEIKNTLGKLLPYRLMEKVLIRGGADMTKKSNQLTKDERKSIVRSLKYFNVSPVSLRPIEEAIITRGGIPCGEISPSTMESKILHGLFFAGEIIDLDALTGGFNLQIAFSTGYLAGLSASM